MLVLQVNPFMWAKLQEVARSDPDDPEMAISLAGVAVGSGAIYYLTPGQRAALEAELEEMLIVSDLQAAEFYVTSCLARAARANARWHG